MGLFNKVFSGEGTGTETLKIEQEQAMLIFGGVTRAKRAASAKALWRTVAVPGLARGGGLERARRDRWSGRESALTGEEEALGTQVCSQVWLLLCVK